MDYNQKVFLLANDIRRCATIIRENAGVRTNGERQVVTDMIDGIERSLIELKQALKDSVPRERTYKDDFSDAVRAGTVSLSDIHPDDTSFDP